MSDFILSVLHPLVVHLPGCKNLGISCSRIVFLVFLLNLLVLCFSVIKGRPLFARSLKETAGAEKGMMAMILLTTLVEIALVLVVYRLSMRFTQLPISYENTMYGGIMGYFQGPDGIETPAPSFGKPRGLDLVQIISANEKEWLYLGSIANILLAYVNFFFALVYYGSYFIRENLVKWKKKNA